MPKINRINLVKVLINGNLASIDRELYKQGYCPCNYSNTTTTTTSTSTSTTTTTTTTLAYDTDAQAYFTAVTTAGGTLSTGDKNAWNAYVLAKKADGTWTKRKRIFPFMGGTAAAHAIDAKTATSKITWNGTITHNGSGAQGDGSTGYGLMDENINVFITSFNDAGAGYYIRGYNLATQAAFGFAFNSSPYGGFWSSPATLGGSGGSGISRFKIGDDNSMVNNDGDFGPYHGYITGNRTTSSLVKMYRNGVFVAQNTTVNTVGTPMAQKMAVLAMNNNGTPIWHCDQQVCFLQFWEGLTDAEAIADNVDVETLQDALSRGVQ